MTPSRALHALLSWAERKLFFASPARDYEPHSSLIRVGYTRFSRCWRDHNGVVHWVLVFACLERGHMGGIYLGREGRILGCGAGIIHWYTLNYTRDTPTCMACLAKTVRTNGTFPLD